MLHPQEKARQKKLKCSLFDDCVGSTTAMAVGAMNAPAAALGGKQTVGGGTGIKDEVKEEVRKGVVEFVKTALENLIFKLFGSNKSGAKLEVPDRLIDVLADEAEKGDRRVFLYGWKTNEGEPAFRVGTKEPGGKLVVAATIAIDVSTWSDEQIESWNEQVATPATDFFYEVTSDL